MRTYNNASQSIHTHLPIHRLKTTCQACGTQAWVSFASHTHLIDKIHLLLFRSKVYFCWPHDSLRIAKQNKRERSSFLIVQQWYKCLLHSQKKKQKPCVCGLCVLLCHRWWFTRAYSRGSFLVACHFNLLLSSWGCVLSPPGGSYGISPYDRQMAECKACDLGWWAWMYLSVHTCHKRKGTLLTVIGQIVDINAAASAGQWSKGSSCYIIITPCMLVQYSFHI